MFDGRTIAVLVHQGMGDCIQTIPLLQCIEANLQPEDRLLIIARSQLAVNLLKSTLLKKNVEIWQPNGRWPWTNLWLIKSLLRLRKMKPDILLAPLLVDRLRNALWLRLTDAKMSVVAAGKWLGRFKRCVIVEIPPRTHKIVEFFEYGRKVGLVNGPLKPPTIALFNPQLKIGQKNMAWWSPNRRWIVFAPGSGEIEAHKRYPVEHFRRLASLLLEHSPDIGIVAIGSANERKLILSVLDVDGEPHRRIALAGPSVAESLEVLSRCDCLVTGCSGSSHLGAIVDIPIVGIYGPTNPGHTGAYSKNLRVVRLGLKCSPCYRADQITGCGNPICMTMIPPETVFQAVLDSLDGKPCLPVPWCETTDAREPAYPDTETRLRVA